MKGFGHAYELGLRAAEQDRSLQSNPYKTSGAAWLNAWVKGYRDGKKAKREERASD